MIQKIADLTNKSNQGNDLVAKINQNFEELSQDSLEYSCSYYIWKNPYMVAGKNTFIDTMLPFCGLKNGVVGGRYPELDEQFIKTEVIFLSTEPYPFKEEDVLFMKEKFPNSFVKIVDGEIFSWYGSRLLVASNYFKELKAEVKSFFQHS